MFWTLRMAFLLGLPGLVAVGQDGLSRPQEANAGEEAKAVLWSVADEAGDPSPVTRWNVIALETTRAAAFNPLRETRSLAMVSAAVFDAVNAITQRYEPYAVRVRAQASDSAEAAAHAAAHDTLIALYPDAKAALDAEYEKALVGLADGPGKTRGIEDGRAAAAALLALRSFDHANEKVEYQVGSGPGVWQPTPPAGAPALEPGWGKVTPFFLETASQYRPGPPPALTSPTYGNDFKEIAAIGSVASPERTAAQTETARFWMSTAPQLWNQAVQQLSESHRLGISSTAFVFLLLNAAGADAMIAAWDSKYTYNQWRPVTAIRAQLGDSAWTPLIPTPPFPDYIAGHTSYAGAAEAVLTYLLGERPGRFSITSATASGATHRYESFGEVAEEVGNARVWGGVHWRTSCTAGRLAGYRTGIYALRRAPRQTGWRGWFRN